jgi:hypothetical protein
MIRLQEAGAPVTWVWTLGTFVALIVALTIIWVAPGIGRLRNAHEWREAVATGSDTPRTGVA